MLQHFQTYNDIDDTSAKQLIDAGEAKPAADEIQGVSYLSAPEAQKTAAFDVAANGGYVAEAQLSEKQKADLANKGEATAPDGTKVAKDETPVTGKDATQPKDTTPEPEVKQKVYDDKGKELTEEEIKAKEQTAAAQTASESTNSAKTSDLQNGGQEVK